MFTRKELPMNYTKFVKLWLQNRSTSEIAEAMDMTQNMVYFHAKKLREAGVKLPDRTVTRTSTIDADKLNALIERY